MRVLMYAFVVRCICACLKYWITADSTTQYVFRMLCSTHTHARCMPLANGARTRRDRENDVIVYTQLNIYNDKSTLKFMYDTRRFLYCRLMGCSNSHSFQWAKELYKEYQFQWQPHFSSFIHTFHLVTQTIMLSTHLNANPPTFVCRRNVKISIYCYLKN